MRKLIIINGSPGVGKTSVSQELYKNLNNSVWLDGDWCWMMHPFKVTKGNKRMVEDNINCLLTNFLNNVTFENVVFSWVIPHDELMERIIDRLPLSDIRIYKFTLMCSEKRLGERMMYDGRSVDQIEDSIRRLEAYRLMDTIKIDTSDLNVHDTVTQIIDSL